MKAQAQAVAEAAQERTFAPPLEAVDLEAAHLAHVALRLGLCGHLCHTKNTTFAAFRGSVSLFTCDV